jgi:hypothetical protein
VCECSVRGPRDVATRKLNCDIVLNARPISHIKLYSVLLTKYHSGNQVKNTEMGRTCGTYGGEVHTGL